MFHISVLMADLVEKTFPYPIVVVSHHYVSLNNCHGENLLFASVYEHRHKVVKSCKFLYVYISKISRCYSLSLCSERGGLVSFWSEALQTDFSWLV